MTLFEIFDPKAPPRPIGIDLGTTNSLVAYVQDGKPHAVLDCDLEVLVPSVVSYDERANVVVGRNAQRRAVSSPRDTIVSVKRFMGRGASDPETKRLGPYEFVDPKSEAEANVVRFKVRPVAWLPKDQALPIREKHIWDTFSFTKGTRRCQPGRPARPTAGR